MLEFIAELEGTIEKERSLLGDYIVQENWGRVGNQQYFIDGLSTALHLAMLTFGASVRESNVSHED